MIVLVPLPADGEVRFPFSSLFLAVVMLAALFVIHGSHARFEESRQDVAAFVRAHGGAGTLSEADRAALLRVDDGLGPLTPEALAEANALRERYYQHNARAQADRESRRESGVPERDLGAALRPVSAETAEQLAALVTEANGAAARDPLIWLSFVPARGLAQIGLLTSTFVHVGVWHLLLNLVLLYLTAPFLENAFGALPFLVLFLLGGMAGDAAELWWRPLGNYPVLGAAGAAGACLGAFAVRFANEPRVIFAGMTPPSWGMYGVQMGRIGGAYPGNPLQSGSQARGFQASSLMWVGLVIGYTAVVLVLTTWSVGHVPWVSLIGGLGFGVIFAFAWGKREPLVLLAEPAQLHSPELALGERAFAAGNLVEAVGHFQRALVAEPHNPDASLGLIRTEIAGGRAVQAQRLIAELLRSRLAAHDAALAVAVARELAPQIDVPKLGAGLAYALACHLSERDDGPLLHACLELAVASPGPLRAKALLRQARALWFRGEGAGARQAAEQARSDSPDLGAEVDALLQEIDRAQARSAPLDL